MQRNQNPGQNPRHNAERDAAQPIAGQPRSDEEDDELQDPEQVPSFLTARELEAKDPPKGTSSTDAGERDEPMKQTDKMLRKDSGGKAR
jgi:hypothetical protein